MNRLYAISDIHGCFDTLYRLVVRELHLEKSDELILLGDYIDRGDKSKEVIDFIMDLQQSGFNVTALTGNHEVMLTDSYYSQECLPLWMLNNGITTLISFGISDIRKIDPRYIDFFITLPYYKIIGNMIFVHAGLNDEADDPFSDKQVMIWESRAAYNHPALSGKTIIHGHRPKSPDFITQQIDSGARVLPIDSGCVYGTIPGYGMLTALDVNNMSLITVPCV